MDSIVPGDVGMSPGRLSRTSWMAFLLIPVLLAVRKHNLLNVQGDGRTLSFSKVCPVVREELHEIFVSKGLAEREQDSLLLTDAGRVFVDRILITGVTASYRPMLRSISELLFGDPACVLDRDSDGRELYVNRTLNVIASGFQHEEFFSALDDMILSVFDRQPYEEQPRYVADMGCGDGTLLKRIYELIRSRSSRGPQLSMHRY